MSDPLPQIPVTRAHDDALTRITGNVTADAIFRASVELSRWASVGYALEEMVQRLPDGMWVVVQGRRDWEWSVDIESDRGAEILEPVEDASLVAALVVAGVWQSNGGGVRKADA